MMSVLSLYLDAPKLTSQIRRLDAVHGTSRYRKKLIHNNRISMQNHFPIIYGHTRIENTNFYKHWF